MSVHLVSPTITHLLCNIYFVSNIIAFLLNHFHPLRFCINSQVKAMSWKLCPYSFYIELTFQVAPLKNSTLIKDFPWERERERYLSCLEKIWTIQLLLDSQLNILLKSIFSSFNIYSESAEDKDLVVWVVAACEYLPLILSHSQQHGECCDKFVFLLSAAAAAAAVSMSFFFISPLH